MKTLQWLSFVAVMSLASPSYADERESSGKRDVSGQALIGAAVQTGGGETLGEVTSVIVDESGYARYAVISHGGIMGFGIKRSAVPWATVQSVLQNDSLVMERASIEQAPVLTGGKRPDPLSGTWSRDAECYWGARTSTRETPYARKQAESPHATPIVPAPTPLTERT
jgi:sporulation protein YlmC with PRC-barrel domain